MRDLGTLGGGGHSQAKAINNRGEVVGWSDARSGHYAFRWQNGRMSRLGTRESGAAVINDRGQIAGRVRSGSGTWHAFLWQSGRMWDLGARVFERPVAINDRGQMIAAAVTRSSGKPEGRSISARSRG